ncbi:autotransporter-associated beta strand repeat-containing protein [Luteolibacter sp. LG18]|uniref:beta strand repeat-containing protein n=1 Tax=Luteolibacter sp. LG18 TaxID=2819286 RepID=UPI002B323B57|nr:hypothetical protein llg_27690 [Luteolibacter sp. LG18]
MVSSAFGSALMLCVANAASLTWDGNGSTAPNPNGGTGTWDVGTNSNWWDGSTNTIWPASGTDNDAVFDTTAGTVTLASGGVTANDLTFNVTGYTVTANALILNGTTPTLTAANGVTATLNSLIVGGGIVKSGAGTVVLGGANSALSGVTLSQGTLQSNNLASLGTGTVTLGDANTGANGLTLFYNAGNTSAVNVVVSANGTGTALIKWSQDVLGSSGKTTSSANDLQFTLNRAVTFQCTSGGKQITPFITGGVGAGNTAITVSGGTQVTLTAAMNAANNAVQVNNFTGNILVTGNTKLQLQNRAYQVDNASYWNGAIPDTSSVTIDTGSTLFLAHGNETIDGLNGSGTLTLDTQQNGHVFSVGGGNGNGVFTGSFSTSSTKTAIGFAKVGTGTQELSGSGISFNPPTTLTNGTLKLTNTTGWASNVALNATNAVTLQVNAALAADSWTFSKLLTGGSTSAKIEKTGAGTVVLNPAASSTFVGGASDALTVTGGKLYVNAPFTTAPAATVASGGLLGGSSTVATVSVAAGGAVEGGQAGTGVLTADNLVFSGTGTVVCNPSATTAPVAVTNTLATGGGVGSVVVSPSTIPAVDGAYHLVQFGTFGGLATDFRFSSPPRAMTIQQNGNFIDLVVSNAGAGYPVWTGTGSGEWSYASGLSNWKLSTTSAATDFLLFDNVLFDDSVGAGNTNVDVSVADLQAGTMTFNHSAVNYTLGGTKDIASGSLVKTGTGKLTITGAYTYPGGVLFGGGRVSVAAETALGTGALTFDGGILEYTGANATWSRGATINAGGGALDVTSSGATVTQSGVLAGTGSFTKLGAGTLTLTGANAYTGGTVIGGGTLAGTVNGLNGGAISVASGATLTFTGNSQTTTSTVTGAGAILQNTANTVLITGDHTGFTGTFTHTASGNNTQFNSAVSASENAAYSITAGELIFAGTGDYTVKFGSLSSTGGNIRGSGSGTGTATLEIGHLGTSTSIAGNVNNATAKIVALRKVGAGTLTLTGSNSYSGGTTIAGGTLRLGNGTTDGMLTAATGVTNNGVLAFNWTTAHTVANVISGTGSVTKDGAGTLTLTGTNTYTGGTTVNAGKIAVNGSSLADSGTLVITGGQVDVTGTEVVDKLFIGTTAAAAGTYGATGSGAAFIDDAHFTGTGVISVTTAGSPYDGWAAGKGLTATNNGPTQDPDHDGVPNLMEYVLGGDPLVSLASILPVQSDDGFNIVLTFSRSDASESEVALNVQWSTDLSTWTDIPVPATTSADAFIQENGSSDDTVSVAVSKSHAVNGKLFVRLKATK